jgi:hypothetical protein
MMTYTDALRHFGTPIALAKATGMAYRTIMAWKKSGRIPQLQQYRLEELTSGILKRSKQT